MGVILLRRVEGAGVALYRSDSLGPAENVPTRVDLFKYSGGYAWGYSGTGPQSLSYAIAGKVFEMDLLAAGELRSHAMTILEQIVSELDSEAEHDIPVDQIRSVCGA